MTLSYSRESQKKIYPAKTTVKDSFSSSDDDDDSSSLAACTFSLLVYAERKIKARAYIQHKRTFVRANI